jgi:hypothetical protein
MASEKICPLLSMGGYSVNCQEDKCAFWVKLVEDGRCSIKELAMKGDKPK